MTNTQSTPAKGDRVHSQVVQWYSAFGKPSSNKLKLDINMLYLGTEQCLMIEQTLGSVLCIKSWESYCLLYHSPRKIANETCNENSYKRLLELPVINH